MLSDIEMDCINAMNALHSLRKEFEGMDPIVSFKCDATRWGTKFHIHTEASRSDALKALSILAPNVPVNEDYPNTLTATTGTAHGRDIYEFTIFYKGE